MELEVNHLFLELIYLSLIRKEVQKMAVLNYNKKTQMVYELLEDISETNNSYD